MAPNRSRISTVYRFRQTSTRRRIWLQLGCRGRRPLLSVEAKTWLKLCHSAVSENTPNDPREVLDTEETMSCLTLELLRKNVSSQRASYWSRRLDAVADLLVAEYGVPTLGNFKDPVKEIFYIVLSAKTSEVQYRRVHRLLIRKYPTLLALSRARPSSVIRCVSECGLANKRGRQVRKIARKLVSNLGTRPSKALKSMEPEEVYRFLTGLPGVGPKSALCIMMYSLGIDVFPVDVHVNRVSARIGAIPRGLKHYQAQGLLPGLVPKGRSKELHVGMLVHGRRVCTPRTPKCRICCASALCKTGKAKGVAGHG